MDKKIYITSDLHFGHNKDFIYGERGFNTIEEHDKTIIKNWNEIIQPQDDVYVLGDLMLNDNNAGANKIRQLNGYLHLVIGNHDTDSRLPIYKSLYNIIEIEYGYRLRYKGYNFFLSHYPALTSNEDSDKPLKKKVINLCGHSHTDNPWSDWLTKGNIYHCELDAHNMCPILLDDIIKDIEKNAPYGGKI